MEEAIEAVKKSISLKPNYADTHKNFGSSLLRSGRLKKVLMTQNLQKIIFVLLDKKIYVTPQWDGIESLHDKRIMIWCEQGIGDTLNW